MRLGEGPKGTSWPCRVGDGLRLTQQGPHRRFYPRSLGRPVCRALGAPVGGRSGPRCSEAARRPGMCVALAPGGHQPVFSDVGGAWRPSSCRAARCSPPNRKLLSPEPGGVRGMSPPTPPVGSELRKLYVLIHYSCRFRDTWWKVSKKNKSKDQRLESAPWARRLFLIN